MTAAVRASTATDIDLLRAHLGGSRDAFGKLVASHLNMVYSAALRQVRDPHLAEDVTQAVFLLLWQKAPALGEGIILPAWLHRAAGYCAANALRLRTIRNRHELKAAQMSRSDSDRNRSVTTTAGDAELSQLLDRAVAKLPPTDRAALIMRYFEGKSAEDVAATLHVTPEAARKRVERAIGKLRGILSRLGVTTAAPALTVFLASRAIVTAPPQLAASVHATIAAAAAASAGSVAAPSTGAASIIAKGALVAMTAKTPSYAVAAIILLLLIGGAVTFKFLPRADSRTLATATSSATMTPPTPSNMIRVQAWIDGRSRLIISGSTAHWSNLEYNPPGRFGNTSRPTLFNGQRWFPVWSYLPVSGLSISDEYKQLAPPLPRTPVTVRVMPIAARGPVAVMQQPSDANQHTLIVEFDDSLPGGMAEYTVDLMFVPVTATASAVGPAGG